MELYLNSTILLYGVHGVSISVLSLYSLYSGESFLGASVKFRKASVSVVESVLIEQLCSHLTNF